MQKSTIREAAFKQNEQFLKCEQNIELIACAGN